MRSCLSSSSSWLLCHLLVLWIATPASLAFGVTSSRTFLSHATTDTTTALHAASADASSSSSNMPRDGDVLDVSLPLKELTDFDGSPQDLTLGDLLQGHSKVAIFGVPGAFTPGCSKSHLPSFMTAQDELKSKGVTQTICLATNDPYVMCGWGQSSGGADAGIRFVSDATGALTKALGLEMETPTMLRCQRFSMIVEGGGEGGGKILHYFSAENQSSDTWAPAVLAKL